MYMNALETEVESLSAEVTRLRLMLNRVTDTMNTVAVSTSPHRSSHRHRNQTLFSSTRPLYLRDRADEVDDAHSRRHYRLKPYSESYRCHKHRHSQYPALDAVAAAAMGGGMAADRPIPSDPAALYQHLLSLGIATLHHQRQQGERGGSRGDNRWSRSPSLGVRGSRHGTPVSNSPQSRRSHHMNNREGRASTSNTTRPKRRNREDPPPTHHQRRVDQRREEGSKKKKRTNIERRSSSWSSASSMSSYRKAQERRRDRMRTDKDTRHHHRHRRGRRYNQDHHYGTGSSFSSTFSGYSDYYSTEEEQAAKATAKRHHRHGRHHSSDEDSSMMGSLSSSLDTSSSSEALSSQDDKDSFFDAASSSQAKRRGSKKKQMIDEKIKMKNSGGTANGERDRAAGGPKTGHTVAGSSSSTARKPNTTTGGDPVSSTLSAHPSRDTATAPSSKGSIGPNDAEGANGHERAAASLKKKEDTSGISEHSETKLPPSANKSFSVNASKIDPPYSDRTAGPRATVRGGASFAAEDPLGIAKSTNSSLLAATTKSIGTEETPSTQQKPVDSRHPFQQSVKKDGSASAAPASAIVGKAGNPAPTTTVNSNNNVSAAEQVSGNPSPSLTAPTTVAPVASHPPAVSPSTLLSPSQVPATGSMMRRSSSSSSPTTAAAAARGKASPHLAGSPATRQRDKKGLIDSSSSSSSSSDDEAFPDMGGIKPLQAAALISPTRRGVGVGAVGIRTPQAAAGRRGAKGGVGAARVNMGVESDDETSSSSSAPTSSSDISVSAEFDKVMGNHRLLGNQTAAAGPAPNAGTSTGTGTGMKVVTAPLAQPRGSVGEDSRTSLSSSRTDVVPKPLSSALLSQPQPVSPVSTPTPQQQKGVTPSQPLRAAAQMSSSSPSQPTHPQQQMAMATNQAGKPAAAPVHVSPTMRQNTTTGAAAASMGPVSTSNNEKESPNSPGMSFAVARDMYSAVLSTPPLTVTGPPVSAAQASGIPRPTSALPSGSQQRVQSPSGMNRTTSSAASTPQQQSAARKTSPTASSPSKRFLTRAEPVHPQSPSRAKKVVPKEEPQPEGNYLTKDILEAVDDRSSNPNDYSRNSDDLRKNFYCGAAL